MIRKWAKVIFASIIAGIGGGLGALLFRFLVNITTRLFFGVLSAKFKLFLMPIIGALFIYPIVKNNPKVRGTGVPEVIESVIFRKGDISGKFAILKIIATSITIGSGGSAGREGPIGFIGASIASWIGRRLSLSSQMRRLITTCGLAAGISGTFNTPLAGAMFALEVIYMGAFSLNLVPIFISSIIGNAITLTFLGKAFGVEIPTGLSHSISESTYYVLMGLVMGVLAPLFAKSLYKTGDALEKIPLFPRLILGALIVGVIGSQFRNYGIFGVGYEGLQLALLGKLGLKIMITLAIAKAIATVFTIASGFSGGIFAPSLYIGAMLGGAFALLFGLDPKTYSLIGMAAFFSALTQAPIAQILMIVELTGGYSLLPAVMIASTLSFLIARFIFKGSSVYTLKLEKRGLKIRTGKPMILEMVKVEEIMSKDVVYLRVGFSQEEVISKATQTGHDCFPVLDNDENVVGIICIQEVLKGAKKPIKGYTIGKDKTARDALELLMKQRILPVVDETGKLVGVVTKSDVYRGYYMALEETFIDDLS
ncbi:voltage-gated chloride channel [Thermococcus chitonophagus]|uniref:Chloride channel protein n=1 Tax=Thermococcus chitonophagus TaxID=54262 RepID=A0A160VR73_9EURY|nr:chloride channel protein [Thermococcus chitonophagus]ASJ16623.1 voltage-gated chloride channel [Thermococcus chitonophagus]CUX77453.1 Chloride channel protein [Thermococcus chitonophagus]